MRGERVRAELHDDLYLVRVDSTAPHNRFLLAGHGRLGPEDLDRIHDALDAAPRGALVAMALHHHPLPLPEERIDEKLVTLLGLPQALELEAGWQLVELAAGRCDLILHGHRHVPSSYRVPNDRPLAIYNAGSAMELDRVRLFSYDGGILQSTVATRCTSAMDSPRTAA
jgi:3',5'-cyclic AMP phosphodiesterase CpdA